MKHPFRSLAEGTLRLRSGNRARTRTTASRLILVFGLFIATGTALLMLPMSQATGVRVGVLDCLFVATSAVCVTGLSTVPLSDSFSGAGQAVILALVQFGGLGITVAGTLFLLVRRGSGSAASEDFIAANVGRLRQARPVDVFLYSCFVVVGLELLGFIALTYLILGMGSGAEVDLSRAMWEAAFHSVSAFCNAGFSLYPEGLVRWRDEPLALLAVSSLTILGGVGLMTLVNFRYFYPWRRNRLRRGRLTLQTRLCMAGTVMLLALGTLVFWVNEQEHTLEHRPWHQGLLWSFFHSAMTRTAGFNVVDNGEMGPATLLGSMIFMFVGGCPGSMAGGVKVTTVVLLGVAARSALRRRSDLTLGGRSVSAELANSAVMVTLLSAAVLVLAIGVLMNVELGEKASRSELHWIAVMYEAVSAFATVGLSTGITPMLTVPGKWIIIFLMFAGRLGPLCLAIHLMRPVQTARVLFPREEVTVG
ncbi:MAG: hypothetical protein IT581_03105 [Verrucomicrobiales bacterium]|nr:hypothetical protein [Verrucomicrobiales bacterium]